MSVCSHGAAMTRAALTKLFILVILTFIICLPEFFTSHRVLRVNFLCAPYQPSERGSRARKGQTRRAEVRRKGVCDTCLTLGSDKWDCSNVTDPRPDVSWFMCETDVDMADLHGNDSLSVYPSIYSSTHAFIHPSVRPSAGPEASLEVSVKVRLGGAGFLNLTLYSHTNHSSLYLPPPEEEEEQEEDEGQTEACYCCFPASESTNRSHRCFLRLSNRTVWTAAVRGKLPWKRTEKDEWWCMFRLLWLVLLCVVLLTVATTVLGQIYRGRCCCEKPKVCPVRCYTGQHLDASAPSLGNCSEEKHTEMPAPKGMVLRSFGSHYWSGLSPIEEVETDFADTLLAGDMDHQSYDITGCNAHLHHRGHPPFSSPAEEQAQ
ncbi:uncharacterized protein [Centroberyx affinis]|uniref:uncharacterized protein isoform X1 n=1 Tax=Centroberyx affinis TaxID=166261 RepID=UPI003A5BBECF